MKKSILLFVAALAAFGCSSDETGRSASIDADSIVGKWRLVSKTISGEPTEISDCQQLHPFVFFNADMTSSETEGYPEGGSCDSYEYDYAYTVNGNVLNEVELGGGSIPFERKQRIIDLTEETLVLKLYYTRQENPSGGVDEQTYPESEQVVSTFERVE